MERDFYIDSLKKSNYKITPQRLRVIDYIRGHTPGHFTAEEVYNEVRTDEPTITLATIYNIMKAFLSAGTIKSFEVNGSTWFETKTDFHGNFICSQCGNIFDVNLDENRIMTELNYSGHQIQEASLLLKGLCGKCKQGSHN